MLTETLTTCDLYDAYLDELQVCTVQLHSYGGRPSACGRAVLVRCPGDNSQVKRLLAEPGQGRLLVVDGGSSLDCALMGDLIAESARQQSWEGVVIFGAIRDRQAIAGLDVHVKALGHVPRKSDRQGQGLVLKRMRCGAVDWCEGAYVYSDEEGLVVSPTELKAI